LDPDRQQQKIIAKGVTEGILKAVGILVLLGIVAGMCVAISKSDFSSGSSSSDEVPVIVLLVNQTSDTLSLEWHADTVAGRKVIPPSGKNACERFHVRGAPGKPWKAAFEIRNLRTGQRDTSGWFDVNVGRMNPLAWVDTVRAGRRRGVVPILDMNVLSANNCSAW